MFVATAFPLPTITRKSGRVRNNFRQACACKGRKAGMKDYVQVASLPYPLSPGAPVLSAPIAASGLSVPPPPPPQPKKGLFGPIPVARTAAQIFKPKTGTKTSGNYAAATPPAAASPGNVGAATDGNFVSAGTPASGGTTSGTYSATSPSGLGLLKNPRRGMGRQFWRQDPRAYYGPRLYLSGMRSGRRTLGDGPADFSDFSSDFGTAFIPPPVPSSIEAPTFISSNQNIPSVINPPSIAPPAPNYIIGGAGSGVSPSSSTASTISNILNSGLKLANVFNPSSRQVFNPSTGQVAQVSTAPATLGGVPVSAIAIGGGVLALLLLAGGGRRR